MQIVTLLHKANKQMRKFILTAIIAFSMQTALATTPVWSTDVAPILYNRCTSCHHGGGIAPFSLMTYSEAVANAAGMAADVSSHVMPPWPPNPQYSHFAHERVLSASEINTIVTWAGGGTPSGDLSLAPPMPTYGTSGMLTGTPDLVVRIPTYTSTASSGDIYQCFSVPSGLLADKYITAFEAIPGNPAIVHHVLVYSDTSGECTAQDAAFPGPGYPNFGGVGSDNANMIGAWVPGGGPMVYPGGFGLRLPANSDIVFQIHYPAGSAGLSDSTEVHFFFAPTSTGIRNLYIVPVLNHESNIDHPLSIAPNTVETYHEQQAVPFDITLLGLAPHMHLLGQNIRSYDVAGTDTTKLIDIPEWDFHWQGFYSFPRLIKAPAFSVLHAEATYDNTTANPENPNSPPQLVIAGESTTDEMMIVYFIFAQYMPGDENIITDSAVALAASPLNNYYHGQQLLSTFPNPSTERMVVKCYFDKPDEGNITLIDIKGSVVKQLMKSETIAKGYNTFSYNVADIPPGTYTLQLRTSERVMNQKIVITH